MIHYITIQYFHILRN